MMLINIKNKRIYYDGVAMARSSEEKCVIIIEDKNSMDGAKIHLNKEEATKLRDQLNTIIGHLL